VISAVGKRRKSPCVGESIVKWSVVKVNDMNRHLSYRFIVEMV
jgi:hypothetical protein